MGRTKGSSVWGAVNEQMDHLKRASRYNAWGIKVAVEEQVKGFTQSEDIVISVLIPYCETGLEWEVIVDSEAPERCPDLVPLPATEVEAAKGFTPSMLGTYDLYRLTSLRSLKTWDLFRRPDSLAMLALDLKRLRRQHEVNKLAKSPLSSAAFQFEAVRDRHEEVDVLVSRAGVRMVFPMWKERREIDGGRGEGETEAAAADAGPVFVYGRAGIRMRLEWTDVAEGKRPDVRVLFPPEAQGLARGFRQPGWTSEMTLYDYLPLAQTAVARPWRERKQLVATLAARHSVLEYDAQDFTLLHLFMKVKVDNFIHLRILRLDIGPDFPEYPPQMTLCDALSDQSWPLDRRGYLYSPRWDAERMATELYNHAAAEITRVM